MNSFQILMSYLKTGDEEVKDIPALDTIPTNKFIGDFMNDDDEKENVESGYGNNLSRAPSRKASRTTSATFRCDSRAADDDTETILDTQETFRPYDDTGQRAYRNACTKFDVLPISKFDRQLGESTTIDMKYYGAGPKAAKAIAIPMVINSRITSLNLGGNGLTAEGLTHIVRMMSENDFIAHLNLCDNNLKTEGANLICEMLQHNHNIETLDISGNGFTSLDAIFMFKALETHTSLKVLNLSHNEFGEDTGKALKSLLAESDSIHDLNLSWNQIRGKAVLEVAKGLKENICLKVLDLSWNGFGDRGCHELAAVLKSCTLTELNLACNRVGAEGIVSLCKALKDNDDLKTLKLGKNPLPEECVVAGLELMLTLDELTLQELDLTDVTFSSKFKDAVDAVKEKHTQFICNYGYCHSYGTRKLKGYSAVGEAMRAIRLYCDNHGINIVELFARFDDDGSMSVSHDEFKEGVKEARIPITDDQIVLLINTFDQDGDGEIDFSEMVLGAEMYKD